MTAHDPRVAERNTNNGGHSSHFEEIGYYEKRKGVFPRKVDGRFRRFKWAWMALTLAIYYATPRSQRIHGVA